MIINEIWYTYDKYPLYPLRLAENRLVHVNLIRKSVLNVITKIYSKVLLRVNNLFSTL